MKSILTIIALTCIFASANAQQGLENIFIEKYYISDTADSKVATGGYLPPNSTTYRIWVDMKPGYSLQAVYGIDGHPLKIGTSTYFFNSEFAGGFYANEIEPKLLSNNTVMLDSWISVGAGSDGHTAVLKSKDVEFNTIKNIDSVLQNTNPDAGVPIKRLDGLKAATPQRVVTVFGLDSNSISMFGHTNSLKHGEEFKTENGSWASFGGAFGLDSSNFVLIAQLTTNGQLSFELNLQLGAPQGGTENYVARNPNGAEFQIPSLIYPQLKNVLPEISLNIKPSKGNVKVDDNISIAANAFDQDGSIRKVSFYVNDVKISEKFSAPYTMNWKAVKEGEMEVHAVAYDDKGAVKTSNSIILKVTK